MDTGEIGIIIAIIIGVGAIIWQSWAQGNRLDRKIETEADRLDRRVESVDTRLGRRIESIEEKVSDAAPRRRPKRRQIRRPHNPKPHPRTPILHRHRRLTPKTLLY